MPVTNPTPPPAIAFSKNEIDIVLQSDDYLAAAAAQSVNFLEFTGAVIAGASLPVTWGKGLATMTCAASPDTSGKQFPPGAGDSAYVTSLLPYFQANYFIDRDYVLTTDFGGAHPRIIFTAIANGPDYDFTNTIGGLAGVTSAGVTDEPVSNFAHHAQIWVETADGTGWQLAFSANIPLDVPENGQTTFDIHEELHAFLDYDKPILSGGYALCPNSVRAYFIKFAQFFGDTPYVRSITRSGTRHIAKGGLGMQQMLIRDIVSEFTTAMHPELTRFLRQGSINKMVTKEQPEWLYHLNLTGANQTVTPVVTMYNSDSTTASFELTAPVTLTPYQKVQFRVGYDQMSVDTRQIGKTVLYYTVQLVTGDGPATQAYGFVVDNQYRPWPRYFVYENSYGAFQTIGTVGKGLDNFDRIKDDAQMAVSRNVAAMDGDFIECDILLQQKGGVSIGYDRAGKRNTALLRDLAASHNIYLYDPLNNKLIPIGISTSNLKDAADGVFLYANTFEYFYKYRDEVWTEDPLAVEDDEVADLLIDAGVVLAPSGDEGNGYFYVKAGDSRIDTDDDGNFRVTDPRLGGKTGYLVEVTQWPGPVLPPDITYNIVRGSFSILVPDFSVVADYPLVVFYHNIDVL